MAPDDRAKRDLPGGYHDIGEAVLTKRSSLFVSVNPRWTR
jgi:hypothetical protein